MKLLAMIGLKLLRNIWSMIRWHKLRKVESDKMIPVDEFSLKSALTDVYAHFKWTMDDWTQLFDSMKPAPYLYNEYLKSRVGDKVLDDCDGYHTIVYHILKNNGFDVALLTVATDPIKESHTMCVIKDVDVVGEKSYRVIDYTSVSKSYSSIDEFISQYQPTVIYWCLDKYDYDKRRFVGVDKDEF